MSQDVDRFGAQRQAVLQRLFPQGVPTLWCPLLTHYTDGGAIDRERMHVHLEHLAPHVGGFLIPGSTGDGWELSDEQLRQITGYAIEETGALQRKLLIGALRFETDRVLDSMADALALIKAYKGNALKDSGIDGFPVCGFTVCAPRGKDLTQEQIGSALESILDLGLPVSLYQLPQITRNEISPQTAEALAAKYPNFCLFKDSSGADTVAQSGFNRVFMVRGAEGDYARHLSINGGRYDGFLLSTANCFARELSAIRSDLEKGNVREAEALSDRLTTAVNEIFALAQKLPHGGAFANANKAADHFFAYGPSAAKVPTPMLCSGQRLPVDMIESTGSVLQRNGLMPEKGYLE